MDRKYTKLTKFEQTLYRELYKKSLYDFVKDFWECCDPSKLVDGFLVQYYCEVFQYACKDWCGYEEIKIPIPDAYKGYKVIDVRSRKRNFSIAVPPRHSKSMIFNVMGPVWLWLSYPVKAASVSHTFGLSKDMNTKRQKLINSEKFKFFFSDEFCIVNNTMDSIKDNRGGELYSKNRDSMTGFGCDLAICDDLTNAEQARKDKQEMSNAWSFFQNTLPSRINDINKGVILNIMQRLAPNDLIGHILNEPKLRDSYTFITLPAIFEEDTLLVCPISGDLLAFKAGEALWPERFGDYTSLRFQVGEGVFQTQYLQKPVATDRTIIKEDMIITRPITEVPTIDQADLVYASHDFPVKDKETSDFLGSVLAYRVGTTLYVRDCLEKRMAFVQSVKYVEDLSNAYNGIIQVIEDKANGTPIIQQLQEKVAGIQPFQPGTQSKTQRLESASLYMSAGNVVFIREQYDSLSCEYKLSDNLINLTRRLTNFPFVEHDDIVDAFSQLLLFVFMDRRYAVYGRAFNEYNMIDYKPDASDYETVFFNKEGDLWKVANIVVRYGVNTKVIVIKDHMFRASAEDGLKQLKAFAPDKTVFIDASDTESFYGVYTEGMAIEKYNIDDFEMSVANMNLALGNKTILLDKGCKMTKADIENFKYDKTKDDTMKFKTTQDGFVACLRIAMKYYGI